MKDVHKIVISFKNIRIESVVTEFDKRHKICESSKVCRNIFKTNKILFKGLSIIEIINKRY